jgi:hypothetical protein
MSEVVTVGLDLAKNVFPLHGAGASGRAMLRRKLRRGQVLEALAGLTIEAGRSGSWATGSG